MFEKSNFKNGQKNNFGMIPIDLGQPEGMLGDEGEQDGEGDEGVQPGNVCREERGQHLQKYP